MARPPLPSSPGRGSRCARDRAVAASSLARRTMLVLLLALGAASAAYADDAPGLFELTPLPPAQDLETDAWRQKGLAYVDLPLGFRARIETRYTRHLYSSDTLAQRHLADAGPEALGQRTLESRVALTRAISEGVEFEIAWESRNNLAVHDPMGFDRQTIGARIRIAP